MNCRLQSEKALAAELVKFMEKEQNSYQNAINESYATLVCARDDASVHCFLNSTYVKQGCKLTALAAVGTREVVASALYMACEYLPLPCKQLSLDTYTHGVGRFIAKPNRPILP